MISDTLKNHLRKQTDRDSGGDYLAGGVACLGRGRCNDAFLTGALHPRDMPRELEDHLDARIRVASISKAVTARTMASLICEGVADLRDDIYSVLSEFDPPPWLAECKITLGDLLTHRSGLWDKAGYFTDPPDDLMTFLARSERDARASWAPGEYFHYANLNYVLAGAAVEALTGDRFDFAARARVLDPLGIRGGFNWSGMAPSDRMRRIPLYQWRNGTFQRAVDGAEGDWEADLIWRNGSGISLENYRRGRDVHLFSPHAGLRMTLPEMARFAYALGDESPEARLCRHEIWRYDGTNGAWCAGLFPAFGLGLTLYDNHAEIAPRLVGHAGHALGFTGGAWFNMESETGWAYFLTGAAEETDGSDDEAFFSEAELEVLRAF